MKHGEVKKGLSEGLTAARRRSESHIIRKNKRDSKLKRFRQDDISESLMSIEDVKIALSSPISIGDGIKGLRNIVNSNEESINFAMETELLPYIAVALDSSEASIKIDALWCLANFATGNHQQTLEITKLVPKLLNILTVEDDLIREQVCWVLGNIAGDCDQCRYQLFPLVNVLVMILLTKFDSEKSLECRVVCAWALSNLMRGITPATVLLHSGDIGDLILLLDHQNQLSIEVAWIFAFITAKDDCPLQLLIGKGIFDKCIRNIQMIERESSKAVPYIVILSNLLEVADISNYSPILHVYLDIIRYCFDQKSHIHVFKEALLLLSKIFELHPETLPLVSHDRFIMENLYRAFLSQRFELKKDSLILMELIYRNSAISLEIMPREVVEEIIKCIKEHDNAVQQASVTLSHRIAIESATALELCQSLGLLDTLEEIQYATGDPMLYERVKIITNDLYARIEAEESISQTNYSSSFTADLSDDSVRNNIAEDSDNIQWNRGVGRGKHLTTPSWMTENT